MSLRSNNGNLITNEDAYGFSDPFPSVLSHQPGQLQLWQGGMMVNSHFSQDESRQSRSERDSTRQMREISNRSLGMRILYQPKDIHECEIDIVAVHGIGADPARTWTHPRTKVNWLGDKRMLPSSFPTARIMAFGYNSVWYGEKATRKTLDGVARDLLRALEQERHDTPNRPIIFLSHCFGGVVIQKAYLIAKMQTADFPNIYDSITGMIFLGTPHHGSDALAPTGEVYKIITDMYDKRQREEGLLKTVCENNEILVDTVHTFTRDVGTRKSAPKLFCFFETIKTRVGRIFDLDTGLEFVVQEGSGTLSGHDKQGLDLDHFALNKFGDENDYHYRLVKNQISVLVKASPQIMGSRSGSHLTHSKKSPSAPMLPFLSVHNFAPRGEIVDQIAQRFEDSVKLILFGRPGTGKTQVAVEYCCKLKEEQSSSKIYWVNARSAAQFEYSYRAIGHSLRLKGTGDELLDEVRNTLEHDTSVDWLLVLDGFEADEESLPANHSEERRVRTLRSMLRYCPSGHLHGGRVLITTRSIDWISREPSIKTAASILEMPRLTDGEVVYLMLNSEKLSELPLKIADRFQRSAAALELLFIYKTTQRDSFSLKKLQDCMNDQPRPNSQSTTAGAGNDAAQLIMPVWRLLHSMLQHDDPIAAQLFHRLCVIDVQCISIFLVCQASKAWGQKTPNLDSLARYGMIKRVPKSRSITVVSIIRLCAIAWLEETGELSQAEELMLSLLAEIYPKHDEKYSEEKEYATCEVLNPCAMAAVYLKASSSIGRRAQEELLLRMAQYRLHRGQYELAVRHLEVCRELQEQHLEPAMHDQLARTNEVLSSARDKLKEQLQNSASPKQNSNFSIRTEIMQKPQDIVPGNPRTQSQVERLSAVAATRHRQDRLFAISNEDIYQRLYEWCSKHLGDDHIDTARQRYNLALTYDVSSQHDKALENYLSASEDMELHFGPSNPISLQILGSLARMLYAQGSISQSEKMINHVLEGQRACLGPDHPDTLVTRHNAAIMSQNRGELEKVEEELRSILAVRMHLLGSHDTATLSTLCTLALNYRLQERYEESEELYTRVLEVQMNRFVEEHPDTVVTRLMRAELFLQMGNIEKARTEFDRVLKGGFQLWDEDHPDLKYVKAKVEELA